MNDTTTFIKLDRNILNWGWYTDTNTKSLFIHILLKANIKESTFKGQAVKRGEFVTSLPHLSKELGLSIQSVRTAINHLKSTGEITVKTTPKYSIITVLNYNKYQKTTRKSTHRQQSANSQLTVNQQQSKNIFNNKLLNIKKERMEESSRPSFDDVKKFIVSQGLNVNASKFYEHYEKTDWKNSSGEPIDDWQQLAVNWSKNEKAPFANGYKGVKNSFTYDDFLKMQKEQENNDA